MTTTIKFIRLSDLPPPPPGFDIDYRRGYVHGALAAIEAFEDGATLAQIIKWLDDELQTWRHGNCDVMTLPPNGPRKPRRKK